MLREIQKQILVDNLLLLSSSVWDRKSGPNTYDWGRRHPVHYTLVILAECKEVKFEQSRGPKGPKLLVVSYKK